MNTTILSSRLLTSVVTTMTSSSQQAGNKTTWQQVDVTTAVAWRTPRFIMEMAAGSVFLSIPRLVYCCCVHSKLQNLPVNLSTALRILDDAKENSVRCDCLLTTSWRVHLFTCWCLRDLTAGCSHVVSTNCCLFVLFIFFLVSPTSNK